MSGYKKNLKYFKFLNQLSCQSKILKRLTEPGLISHVALSTSLENLNNYQDFALESQVKKTIGGGNGKKNLSEQSEKEKNVSSSVPNVILRMINSFDCLLNDVECLGT